MATFPVATGKAQYGPFFKLDIQSSPVISLCFSHPSADVLHFLHAQERALCFDAPNCTPEFYMSSVGDLTIVPIKKEGLNQLALFRQISDEVSTGLAGLDRPRSWQGFVHLTNAHCTSTTCQTE